MASTDRHKSARHGCAFPGGDVLPMEATARTRWTDDRLDDLKQSVDGGFLEVKESIRGLGGRVDRLQHTLVIAVVAMCAMMFAGFGALITLFATHF